MMKTYRAWGGVAVVAVLFVGCQDPAYDAALTQHQANFDRLLADAHAREAAGPDNLKELALTSKELERLYAHRLGETLEQIQRKYRRDQERWQREAPLRRKRFDQMMKGHPERIPETWGKMTY